MLTFDQLVQYEPRLGNLLSLVQYDRKSFRTPSEAMNAWYDVFKPRLCRYVGWEAEKRKQHPELGSMEAYDLAYDYLLDETMKRPRRRTKKKTTS